MDEEKVALKLECLNLAANISRGNVPLPAHDLINKADEIFKYLVE